jgi:uncharacterized membrane protein
MIVLAGLIHLPKWFILIFSCIIICGHNLFDSIHFEGSILWSILHERNRFNLDENHSITTAYSLLPWIAVMSLGYCFGPLYDKKFEADKRKKLLNKVGIGSLVLFIILVTFNSYGNPEKWINYGFNLKTVMSVFNLAKYPPS